MMRGTIYGFLLAYIGMMIATAMYLNQEKVRDEERYTWNRPCRGAGGGGGGAGGEIAVWACGPGAPRMGSR